MCVLKCVSLAGRWVISGRTPTGYSEHQVPDVSKPLSYAVITTEPSPPGFPCLYILSEEEWNPLPLGCPELSRMSPGPHPQRLTSVLAFWIYSFPGRHEGLCLHCHPTGIWWNWQYGPSGSISTRMALEVSMILYIMWHASKYVIRLRAC